MKLKPRSSEIYTNSERINNIIMVYTNDERPFVSVGHGGFVTMRKAKIAEKLIADIENLVVEANKKLHGK